MAYRFTLAAVATFAVIGCAKPVTGEPTSDFNTGATLVTVKHAWTHIDDGATVYVTVEGKDAAALKIGGYAKSQIGKVSLAPVKLTTLAGTTRAVKYAVTKSKAAFIEIEPDENPETKKVPRA